MNTGQLVQELLQHNPDRYTVLQDPASGLIHSLQFIIQETDVINGHQDLRCGPHNLTHRPRQGSPILHSGQQSWSANPRYTDTPGTAPANTHAREGR